MSTKVKGDKIKEGSIPLSALDDKLKNEINCKYGLSGVVCILNSNNTTSDIFIISDYFVYVSSKNTIIKLKIGEQTDLAQLGGPSTIITSEVINGYKVKFSVSGSMSYYGDLIIGDKYNEVPIPTPNWNAQEGEAGYIENRTHSTKPYNKIVINDEDISAEYTLLDGLENNFAYQLEGYDRIFRVIAPETNKPIGSVEPNDWGHISSFGHGFGIICSQGKIYINNNYGYVAYKNITFWNEQISKLDEIFLPDTVLKTTPQILSDTDKNQALTNLGIDPVVWKYMCNPCIIKSGVKVPEELIGDFDEEDQQFYIKYPYKNMYVVEFGGHRINLTDASVINILAYGCIEENTEKIKFAHVVGWIDKDKEWHLEG